MSDLFERQVTIDGSSSSEPTLQYMVFHYYRSHDIDRIKAAALTKELIDVLTKETADAKDAEISELRAERDTLMHERAVIVADHNKIASECAELRAKVAGLEGRLAGYAAASTDDMNDIVQLGMARDAAWNEAIEAAANLAGRLFGDDATLDQTLWNASQLTAESIRELRK